MSSIQTDFLENFIVKPLIFKYLKIKSEKKVMLRITLPDKSVREYPAGVTGLEIAASISEGLARNVLAAKVNGQVWDATRQITTDSEVKLLT